MNVAMAGAIVMYDRVRTLGNFTPRPLHEGGPVVDADRAATPQHFAHNEPRRLKPKPQA